MRMLIAVLFLLLNFWISAQIPVTRQLAGTLIRSSTVEENKALIGLKGKNPGSGIVYYSKNGMKSWSSTNNGLAIGAKVHDVQAVALVDDTTFLAGTWKNGLYISTNTGKTWGKVENFPASDIRSLVVSKSKKIYAATTSHGIMNSTDLGNTWKPCSDTSYHRQSAAWAIELDPLNQNILYAMSFRSGIQKSTNQGKTWNKILKRNGMMLYDLAISKINSNNIWAIGGNDSLGVIYASKDKGTTWAILKELPKASLTQIAITGENEDVMVVGSWDKGIHIYNEGKWGHLDEIKFESIANIIMTEKEITIFSWGDGIYKIPNDWIRK